MPTITLNKKRVLNILGKKITDDELKENISYLGTDLEEINKDEIIVEIFPNRPDLLSEEGFGRALKSFLDLEVGLKEYKKSFDESYEVIIDKSVRDVRPYTACAVIKNLVLDEEKINDIINIQEKLHVTYGRNRKRCAIGIYPCEKIKFPIYYKALKPEEIKFVPLNESVEFTGAQIIQETSIGKEYGYLLENKKNYPLFIDSNNSILSMPPIVNSAETGRVTSKTKNIFIECSGHNFGVVSKAINMVCAALADMGGQIHNVSLKYPDYEKNTPELEPENMILSKHYVNKYLGLKLDEHKILSLLKKMGFDANIDDINLKVKIPCYRTDILHPIDLVEDICISYGFNNLESEKDKVVCYGEENFGEKINRKIREALVGLGFFETVNYNLANALEQEKLGFTKIVKLKNSLSTEYDSMRSSIIISMLKNFKVNKNNDYPQSYFEIGTVFEKNDEFETNVLEQEFLCVSFIGENASFTKAKQTLDVVFRMLGLDYVLKSEKTSLSFLINERTGNIYLKNSDFKEIVGFIGELHPQLLYEQTLDFPVCVFELNLNIIHTILQEQIKKQN